MHYEYKSVAAYAPFPLVTICFTPHKTNTSTTWVYSKLLLQQKEETGLTCLTQTTLINSHLAYTRHERRRTTIVFRICVSTYSTLPNKVAGTIQMHCSVPLMLWIFNGRPHYYPLSTSSLRFIRLSYRIVIYFVGNVVKVPKFLTARLVA